MNTSDPPLAGEILEYGIPFTVHELCRLCAVDRACIQALVEEGIVVAERDAEGDWRFSGGAPRRVRTALRLHRDLEINLAGVALALELLEELDRLRRALDAATPRS
jgi:chaperone modulatory protein CbpM